MRADASCTAHTPLHTRHCTRRPHHLSALASWQDDEDWSDQIGGLTKVTVHAFDHSALPDLDDDEQALAEEELEAELEKLAEDAASGEDAISEEERSCLCTTVNLADSCAPSLRSQGEAGSSFAPRTKGPDLRGACFSDAEMGHGIVLSLNAGHNQKKYAFNALVIKAGVVSLEIYDDYKPTSLKTLVTLDSTVEDALIKAATEREYVLKKVRRLCMRKPLCWLRFTLDLPNASPHGHRNQTASSPSPALLLVGSASGSKLHTVMA